MYVWSVVRMKCALYGPHSSHGMSMVSPLASMRKCPIQLPPCLMSMLTTSFGTRCYALLLSLYHMLRYRIMCITGPLFPSSYWTPTTCHSVFVPHYATYSLPYCVSTYISLTVYMYFYDTYDVFFPLYIRPLVKATVASDLVSFVNNRTINSIRASLDFACAPLAQL